MKKIALLCSAGMSTSILVKKMREASESMGLEYNINAYSIAEASTKANDADMVLLGPQVRFQINVVKEQLACPVEVIDMRAYGMMDGKKVIDQVFEIIGE